VADRRNPAQIARGRRWVWEWLHGWLPQHTVRDGPTGMPAQELAHMGMMNKFRSRAGTKKPSPLGRGPVSELDKEVRQPDPGSHPLLLRQWRRSRRSSFERASFVRSSSDLIGLIIVTSFRATAVLLRCRDPPPPGPCSLYRHLLYGIDLLFITFL
jgi:hypothetical protein